MAADWWTFMEICENSTSLETPLPMVTFHITVFIRIFLPITYKEKLKFTLNFKNSFFYL